MRAPAFAPPVRVHRRPAVLLYLILGLGSYFASAWLLGHYTGSDQAHYTRFYESLVGAPLADIAYLQGNLTGSSEPLYGHLMWTGANVLGLDHTMFISIWNMALVLALVGFMRKHQAPLIVIALVLTNYYLLVLAFSAERLKFAYLFVTLGMLAHGWWRYLFFAAAPIFHFQTIILYAAGVMGRVHDEAAKGIRGGHRIIGLAMLATVGAAALSYRYMDAILGKFAAYTNHAGGLMEVADVALLIATGMIVSNHRWRLLFLMAPMIWATFMLGGETRMNMATFTVLCAALIYERRSAHPLFIALLAYCSFKSIGFIDRVLEYGSAFARPVY